jgi:hypothetical protein
MVAVPTITGVSPSPIYTGGQLIAITGTGFRTRYPTPPETPHPWPTPRPTVAVLVDGRAANRVLVESSSRLTCVVPSHAPGSCVLTIKNLDSDGVPISGEQVSASNLLTFERVDLTLKTDLARVIEALETELKNQVIDNVSFTTSVDYDSDPDVTVFAGVDMAAVPALCLSGPEDVWDRPYNTSLQPTAFDSGQYERRTTFAPQDLVFRLLCLDDSGLRSINLVALVTQFFKSNNYLYLDRDPSDLTKGQVCYELEGGPFVGTSVNNDNDIRAFSGPVTIKGFQFEDVAGFPKQTVVERTVDAESFNVVGVAVS